MGKTLLLLLALSACGNTPEARNAEWAAAGELLTLGLLGVATGYAEAATYRPAMTTCFYGSGVMYCQ